MTGEWSGVPGQAMATGASGLGGPGATAQGTIEGVRTVRRRLGVSRRIFARMTGFSERAIADWEGGHAISGSSLRRLHEIERLGDALARTLPPGRLASWFETPSEAFDGLKPVEVLERGEVDRIWGVLFAQRPESSPRAEGACA